MNSDNRSILVTHLGTNASISGPESIVRLISSFFTNLIMIDGNIDHYVTINALRDGEHDITWNGTSLGTSTSPALTLQKLLVTFRERSIASDNGRLLRASAVGWGSSSIVLAGDSIEAGNVAAWFVARGFSYISQGLVSMVRSPDLIEGAAGPMMIGSAAATDLCALDGLRGCPALGTQAALLLQPDATWTPLESPSHCALIIDVRSISAGDLAISEGDDADICGRLAWTSGRDRDATARRKAAAESLVRAAPTISVHFSSMAAPDATLDTLARLIAEDKLSKNAVASIFRAIRPKQSRAPVKPATIPRATVLRRGAQPKLTIGMATYDDYDGVYFSTQALRLYHREAMDQAEILVIDNNPAGPCGSALKELDGQIENYRYIPEDTMIGTAVRDRIFSEASGTYVLCMDCHILFETGSISALLRYFHRHPDTNDLIQGPLIWDDLKASSAYWDPEWGSGMFGKWAPDSAVAPDEPAFEIPMQGLGVFACRQNAWPGFNPGFRGFGGEEGYIHEKFRQRGDRVVCLPSLRWIHRFARPMGSRYPVNWGDRIHNYLLGRSELGLPVDDVISHMKSHLGAEFVDATLASLKL
jgi:hypothetical protein